MPRAIALGAPRIFEVKMGRGDLRVKTKSFVSLSEPTYLKNLKKVVNEKVFKSKKPKNMPKTAVFLPQKADF